MVAIVTTEQAIAHLRLDDLLGSESVDLEGQAQELAYLEDAIDRAEESVLDYLKHSESTWEDPSTVPKPIQQATLLLISAFYEDREGTGDGDYFRPDGAIARLLVRFRDPALA